MLLALIATPIATLFFLSSHTRLAFDPQPHEIGVSTWVGVRVSNPHGTRDLSAWIEQNGMKMALMQTKAPADRLKFWLAQVPDQDVHFMAGSKAAPALKEGPARLVVQAQSNDFRGATDTISTDVDVMLRPPSVSADGFQHYINQGGSEMVLLTPSGAWSEAGVRVGKDTYRSFPIAGSTQRLALFAYPGLGRRNGACGVREKFSGYGGHGALLVQDLPEEVPHARSGDRRQVSRQGGESDRSRRIGRSADALSENQRRNAPRRTTRLWRTCASRLPRNFCGPIHFCNWPTPKLSPNSPTYAATSTKARRWISRCIWGSIWPFRRIRRWWRRTTAG